MKELNNGGVLQDAANKAGMDRKTARRYLKAGQGPAELRGARGGNTRQDPVAKVWAEAQGWLELTPELEAKGKRPAADPLSGAGSFV